MHIPKSTELTLKSGRGEEWLRMKELWVSEVKAGTLLVCLNYMGKS